MTRSQSARIVVEISLRCRAILFDMDGTLVDSNAVIHRAWKWWSARHGLPLEPILAVEKGRPNNEVLRQFAPHLDIDAEAASFLEFETNDLGGLVAIPGAQRAVAAAQGGLWAVVTSAERSLAEVRLRAVGLPIPDVLVGADSIHRGKPDPECYLLAAACLGVSPNECVVFEDAPAGIASAKAASMKVVAILTSFCKEQLPAGLHIRDFRDLDISRNAIGFELSIKNF